MTTEEVYSAVRSSRPDIHKRVVSAASRVVLAPPGADPLELAARIERSVMQIVFDLLSEEGGQHEQP